MDSITSENYKNFTEYLIKKDIGRYGNDNTYSLMFSYYVHKRLYLPIWTNHLPVYETNQITNYDLNKNGYYNFYRVNNSLSDQFELLLNNNKIHLIPKSGENWGYIESTIDRTEFINQYGNINRCDKFDLSRDGIYSYYMSNNTEIHTFVLFVIDNNIRLMSTYGGQDGIIDLLYNKTEFINLFNTFLFSVDNKKKAVIYSTLFGINNVSFEVFDLNNLELSYTFRKMGRMRSIFIDINNL